MTNKRVIEIVDVGHEDGGNFLHTCPYAEEIHGDYESLCTCNDEETRQCAMDI